MDFLRLKLVLIGDPAVGKTSIRRSFMGETFEKSYLQTLGCDFSSKTIEVDRIDIQLSIWDLAGQPKLESIHPYYFQGASVAFVVYDVTNPDTLENTSIWVERFVRMSGYHRPILFLVGNKVDLPHAVTETRLEKKLQEIREESGHQLALISHQYTSALTGENIEEMFKEAGRIIIAARNSIIKSPSVENEFNISKLIPTAYYCVFNELIGPLPISSSPYDSEIFHDSDVVSNVSRLLSSLDFKQVISDIIHIGKIPWTNPQGMAIFLAAGLENPESRGGYELHAIAFIFSVDMSPLASRFEDIIIAHLHKTLNQIHSSLKSKEVSLGKTIPEEIPTSIKFELSSVLTNTRNQIYQKVVRRL